MYCCCSLILFQFPVYVTLQRTQQTSKKRKRSIHFKKDNLVNGKPNGHRGQDIHTIKQNLAADESTPGTTSMAAFESGFCVAHMLSHRFGATQLRIYLTPCLIGSGEVRNDVVNE